MSSTERRAQLKQKAISEGQKLAIVVAYLWALFIALQLHKFAILRQQNPAMPLDYKIGFALINALVLGKIILLGEAFHLGRRYQYRPLLFAVLFKSAAFAVLLVVFDIVEEVIVGLLRHKPLAESIPALGGGGLEGILIVALMAFIVLIPFFSLAELSRRFFAGDMFSMILRPHAPSS